MFAKLLTPLAASASQYFGSREAGWIGVDVGSTAVKLAQVERHQGKWRLAFCRILPLAAGDRVENGGLHGDRLPGMLRDETRFGCPNHIRSSACVLPMSVVEHRALEVPGGSRDELLQMAAVELGGDGETAGPGREMELLRPAESTAAGGMVVLDVLSVPTHVSLGTATCLLKAGLTCRILDTVPCALARAVSLVEPPTRSGTVAAIDWGCESPLFVLINNGEPVFVRSLRECGFGLVLDRMSESLKQSKREIHDLLAALDGSRCDPSARSIDELMQRVARPVLTSLLEEVQKTLAYLRFQGGLSVPKRIWLFGAGALLPGGCREIADSIRVPTDLWRLESNSDHSSGAPRAVQALLGPAVALSLLGVPGR